MRRGNPVQDEELQKLLQSEVIFRAHIMNYIHYDALSYEKVLEQALLSYIEQNKEYKEKYIDLVARSIVPPEVEKLSMHREDLLKSLQMQLRLSETRYHQLVEELNAAKVRSQHQDDEIKIMEIALTKLNIDVEELIGRPPRLNEDGLL